MNDHNQIHNDIKPQNYLVRFLNVSDGKCQRIRGFICSYIFGMKEECLPEIEIVLTDFGLAGSETKGGTPIFASPECLSNPDRKDKSSDIFSLGRVFLSMILTKEKFLEFLFVPLTNCGKEKIMKLIEKEPILNLISKMIRVQKRIGIETVRGELESVVRFLDTSTVREITETIQNSMSECLKHYISNLEHFS